MGMDGGEILPFFLTHFLNSASQSERASELSQQYPPEHTVSQGFRVLESSKKSEYNILLKNMVQLLCTLSLILVSTKKIPQFPNLLYSTLFNVLEFSGD
jgi:hypothetical protein